MSYWLRGKGTYLSLTTWGAASKHGGCLGCTEWVLQKIEPTLESGNRALKALTLHLNHAIMEDEEIHVSRYARRQHTREIA